MKNIFHIIVRWTRRRGLSHLWPIAAYLLAYLIWFQIVEAVPRSWYLEVSFPLDRYVPLVEIFVVPYLSWFIFITWGIFYTHFADREAFDEMSTILMIGMTLFLLISTFLPNRQGLRVTDLAPHSVFARWILRLWEIDTPTNVFPSIHVFNSAAVAYGVLKGHVRRMRKKGKRGLVFSALNLIWSVLIIFSTVFIRQHSLFDVISALVLIAVSLWLVRKRGLVFRFLWWDRYVDYCMSEVRSAEKEPDVENAAS